MGTAASVDSNKVDEHSGLTKPQKIAIRNLWKNIQKDVQKHSAKLFVRFFNTHPEYKKYFVSQAGASMTKIAEEAHIQSHFRAIIVSISSLIKTMMKNPKKLTDRLHHLAMLHKDMGIGVKDFHNFRDVLVEYLKKEYPKEMNSFEIAAWNMFLSNMFRKICERMDELNLLEKLNKLDNVPEFKDKRSLLGKVFKKKPPGKKYWQQRRNYWENQKALWSENKSSSSEEEGDEGAQKTLGAQVGETVTSFLHNLGVNSALNNTPMQEQPRERRLSNYSDNIPMPEGGFVRRGSQAPRLNAGNARPRAASVTSKQAGNRPPGFPAPKQKNDNQAEGCLPCSPARWRRRNSFNDTYQPP